MICPKCNGKVRYQGGGQCWCDNCSTMFEEADCIEPMTNEEYIRSCSTEQLAEELHEHFMWGVSVNAENGFTQEFMDKTKNHILEWLKQPHTPKE